jgi:hypothetical protein
LTACPEADTILRIAGQLEVMGLAMIFKLGAMPYDTVERSMRLFGEEVVPRIRHLLGDAAAGDDAVSAPALQPA